MDIFEQIIDFFQRLVKSRIDRAESGVKSQVWNAKAKARSKASSAFNNAVDGTIDKAKGKAKKKD